MVQNIYSYQLNFHDFNVKLIILATIFENEMEILVE